MGRRLAFLALLFAGAGGCALVAGLRDRDPADDAGGPSDATVEAQGADAASEGGRSDVAAAEGGGDAGSTPDGATASDASDASDASRAADGADGADGADATDGADAASGADACVSPPLGVACGSGSACTGGQGCCVEAGVCATIVACPGHYAPCDGPEDCSGNACCPLSTSLMIGSTCNAGGCQFGNQMCHSSCDCTAAAPLCCPFPNSPTQGRCLTSCP